ncbi:hypothetical protein AN958_03514 [Leucoagaricus sp. SymC.cos]|nr:hypothetical protein AN958_03514 [Leucoagaricus sp. SymC.cos]
MSIVSAILSSRSSRRINARIAFLMDNLFAIAFGLGLRFIVDNVSNHDFKLTGTLVGLWEGVVTLHFLKKMPKSVDPYIAYVARLFIDFLVTESVIRPVLVVVWTGLGMVLADIAPAIWYDVGGHRVWRRFRRDMYDMSRSVPSIEVPTIFPRARVVRFSPVIEPTEISDTMSTLSPAAATPTVISQAPTTQIVPPTTSRAPQVPKRRVPGFFPSSVISETETDRDSVLGTNPPASVRSVGSSRVRYTVRPRRNSIESETPSTSIDRSNVSSDKSSVSAETPSQVAINIEEQVEVPVPKLDKGKGKALDIPETNAPRDFILPPTPSDSYRPPVDRRSSIVPTITGMPSIPDFNFESNLGSDWEDIRKEDAEQPPTPPEKDFDSRSLLESPPAHYIPPPSVYEPTPRPSIFDRDLWDDVSNAAPLTPYSTSGPTQRTSRLPQTTPPVQAPEPPVVSAPVRKKRRSEPPPPQPVPQTPIYGDSWDTEKDQLPPQTPSVFSRTPLYDHTMNLTNEAGAQPADVIEAPSGEQEQRAAGVAPEQQGPNDLSFATDDPLANPTPSLQPEDLQTADPTQPTVPQTPAPPTPWLSGMPQRRPGTAPPTPQNRPGTVPPTTQQLLKSAPPTPHHQAQPVPPISQQPLKSVPAAPQQKPQTVPPTPHQPPQPVPPTPHEQPQPVSPDPQQLLKSVLQTPQQKPGTVPPAPRDPPQPAPPATQEPLKSVPPTSLQQSQTVPPIPAQVAQTVAEADPAPVSGTVLPTPFQQAQPIPPEPRPQTTQQPTKTVPGTPQVLSQAVRGTPQQPAGQPAPGTQPPAETVPPTPQSKPRTVVSTPLRRDASVLLTPKVEQGQGLFNDSIDPGEGDDNLGELFGASQQQSQSQPEGNLVDLGDDEAGAGADGGDGKSPEGEGGDANGENNEGREGKGKGKAPPEEEVQLDPHNNLLSPASSGYSSIAGAIIIRAQIHELTKRIEDLKEEKLRAQGREEVDPLSEESTLKELEIQRTEKSLEKLKKRAEKRYNAAVESTGQLTIGKVMNINFENTPADEATMRLEDMIGLLFHPNRKLFKMEIIVPKAGAGKAIKTAVAKVFADYGIKSIPKVTTIGVSVQPKAYIDLITAFRQQHVKEDDS